MIWLGLFIFAAVIYFVASDIQLMKKGLNSIPKRKIYQSILVSDWSLVCILIVLWWTLDFQFKHLFYFEGVKETSIFMENRELVVGLIVGVIVGIVIVPFFMKSKKSNKMDASLEQIDFMLPKTVKQRITFFFIALTAGVCEEIIFRGAVTYFFMNLPFGLPLWMIGITGAIIFGIAHWYQGISGILSTGFLGFILFIVFIQTGSLLVPIIIHFIIDVKFVFMPDWKKGEEVANT